MSEIIKLKANLSSSISRKREVYIKEMQPLLKKNVIKYVGSNKYIKITFNKKGIEHIANDMIEKNLGISKKELSKLENFLREAEYFDSSKKYKDRVDKYDYFYYFKDKYRNLYYHIAEEANKMKKGRIILNRYLYAITKTEPKK